MTTAETTVIAGGEGRLARLAEVSADRRARPPADFVYENGQIILELLRRRAAEEERRSFIEGLRRLDGCAGD
jgi:hypothetical protein